MKMSFKNTGKWIKVFMKSLKIGYINQIGEVNVITLKSLIPNSGCCWDKGLHVYFFHSECDLSRNEL